MPEDLLQRRECPAPHDEPGREVVPGVVEPERSVEVRGRDRLLEALPDAPLRPHAALDTPLAPRGQDLVHRLAHRDLPAPAGLRDLEPEDATREVDTVPGQPEQ